MKKSDFKLTLYRAKSTVFTLNEIALLTQETNRNTLKSKIHYYVKKGVIEQVRRGIYVKVEISKRIFPDHYKVMSYLGIPMLVMTQDDLFAHKLIALLDRKSPANRDYFDLWFFMQNHWDINKEIVELRTGLSLKEYLKKCARIVEAINEKYILQGLGEVLDTKLKNWTRENLKKELLFLIRFYLENV